MGGATTEGRRGVTRDEVLRVGLTGPVSGVEIPNLDLSFRGTPVRCPRVDDSRGEVRCGATGVVRGTPHTSPVPHALCARSRLNIGTRPGLRFLPRLSFSVTNVCPVDGSSPPPLSSFHASSLPGPPRAGAADALEGWDRCVTVRIRACVCLGYRCVSFSVSEGYVCSCSRVCSSLRVRLCRPCFDIIVGARHSVCCGRREERYVYVSVCTCVYECVRVSVTACV